jgi:hypothetical protein
MLIRPIRETSRISARPATGFGLIIPIRKDVGIEIGIVGLSGKTKLV